MKKMWIPALISFTLVLLLAGAGMWAYHNYFTVPYREAASTIPQTGAALRQEAGGLTLSWPAGENADDYLVELTSGKTVLWSTVTAETSCAVPGDLGTAEDVTLTVTPRKGYETPRGQYIRSCKEPLRGSYPAVLPSLDALTASLDPDTDTLTLTWDTVTGGVYTLTDGSGAELAQTGEGRAQVVFGTDVPMPAKGETVSFTVTGVLEGFDVVYENTVTASTAVAGEDLRDSVLTLTMEELPGNRCALSWNETRGDRYELQLRRGTGEWTTLGTFTDQEGRSWSSEPLEPFEDYTFRVTALGDRPLEGSEFAAQPGEATFTSGPSVLYATVWTVKDLDVWSDTSKSQKVGKAVTGKSYCVMGEEDHFFLIYLDGAKGWIDSTYCLINLPDYLGDLIAYDIRNSYDSYYMVHDYGIPEITGTVVTGYEEVGGDWQETVGPRTFRPGERPNREDQRELVDPSEHPELYVMDDGGLLEPQEFLVPLLYPTAQKVMEAGLAAQAEGYRLKIYDAFRPYIATRFLYDQTERLLGDELPALPYAEMAGIMWEDYLEYLEITAERERDPLPDLEDPADAEVPEDFPGEGDPADQEPVAPEDIPEPEAGERTSYYTMMTNGRFSLGAFLARSGSLHNLGIAVDLTLERLDTGEELEMQTAMHDLSWYSVVSRNNDNAKLLAKYMTGAGLGPLSSEWWHFQDDELRSRVSLSTRQYGVTRAGWMCDGYGWRYRDTDGYFLTGGTYDVEGREWTFDDDGYTDYDGWEQP